MSSHDDEDAGHLLARVTDGLAEHLAERYGTVVTALTELDTGVFRVDRAEGTPWVARVFPAARPMAEVEGDAAILRSLERAGFPAERCAHAKPVSELAGQGVLVTGLVEGTPADGSGHTFAVLGALLGRLHARSAEGVRAGGGWHHLVASGTPSDEIEAALALLGAAGHHQLSEQVLELDDCADLPHAFVHPDFVPANAIATPDGKLSIIDWTNAGRGPRLWSLGFLLFAAGARSPKLVDVVVSRYRRHTELEPEELTRLPDAIRARPLLIDCWSVAVGRKTADQVATRLSGLTRLSERIATQTRQAFAQTPPSS